MKPLIDVLKKSFLIYVLTLYLSSFFCEGVRSQTISKGQFRQMFTQGNLMILDNFYDTASKTFLALNQTDPSNANVNYKLGYCYLHLPGQKLKAIPYLENALKQTAGNYREDDPSEKMLLKMPCIISVRLTSMPIALTKHWNSSTNTVI